MAIKILDSPDPLSEFSLLGDQSSAEPLLIESSASRILRVELERYCRGMINGRSFLIAGHRGAGKTTLVAKAFMDVWRTAEKGAPMLRPLFIPLHGPSLFPSPAPRAAAESAKDDAKPKSEAQIALEQITLGLHRAVAREFAVRYRTRAQTLAELRRRPNGAREWLANARAGRANPDQPAATADAASDDTLPDQSALDALTARLPSERELFEVAGQFEAELQEAPSSQRLREFWERAHALSGGVLFRSGQAPRVGLGPTAGYQTPSVPPGLFPNLTEVHGQGVRELVALTGVLEAYRRISGDYKRTEGEKASDTAANERTTGFSADAKELTTQIVSLLTGGLMATGLAVSGAKPGITALGGIATALGAGLVFKATSTRKRERSTTRESQFIYDLSVATLDRVLPILIERLRAAGLAPVFVVDELDKVKELSARLVSMVHHLKKLVAENAFFCFLTNRSYFEEMLAQGSGLPYPVEYTYYTHRLFVVFAPEDFERYLEKRIPTPQVAAPPPAVIEPSPSAPETTATVPVSPRSVEQTACAMLRWALRHRAQLHAVDLQREIAAIRGDKDEVSKSPDLITSDRRTLIDLTFQIGIELTLARNEPEKVMLDRPEFRRLMHDAMYYLSRCWVDGVEEVDLVSNEGLKTFRVYLEGRTGREEEQPNAPKIPEKRAAATSRWRRRELPSASHAEDVASRGSVNLKDADFLFSQVGDLADFLSDREPVDQAGKPLRDIRIDEWKQGRNSRKLADLEPDLISALLVGGNASILEGKPATPGVYRFRHRVAGRPFASQPAVTPPGTKSPPVPAPRDVGAHEMALAPKPVGAGTVPHPETASPPEPVHPTWEDQATLIDSFANMVRSVTKQEALDSAAARGTGPRRGSAVTLDAFATEYRLIPPTPTPSIALKAITNLRDGAARGTRQSPNDEDVFQIDQFARILQRNGPQIAQAIVLAAIIGRADQSRPVDEQIAVGLRVISTAMRFSEKSEAEVNTSLENIAAMVSAAYGNSFEPALQGIIDAWPNIAAVAAIVQPAIAQATRLSIELKKSLGERAWPTAHDRLNHWIKTNELLDAELDELLAAAAGVGPTEYIGLDPRHMTLAQWTQTLLKARADAPFLILYALNAMGFAVSRDDEFLAIKRWAGLPDTLGYPTAATEDWPPSLLRTHKLILEWGFFRRNTPITTIVVLRRSRSTIMAGWRPMPNIAALVITVEELSRISESTVGLLQLPTTPNHVCAVEMDAESGVSLYSHQFPFMQSMLRGPASAIFAYPSERPITKQPSIVRPNDVQALASRAIEARAPIPTQ